MFNRKDSQVFVAGAGPVGLMATLTMRTEGLDVMLADRADRAGTHSYALALHPASLDLLADFGLADALLDHACLVDQVVFCDRAGPRSTVDLSVLPYRHPFLAVVGQDNVETLLMQALRDHDQRVLFNHRVNSLEQDDRGVTVSVDRLVESMTGYATAHFDWFVDRSFRVETPLVLGCDGHMSVVRRRLGIPFPEVGPVQTFAVFEFRTNAEMDREVRVLMDRPGESAVLWPLPGGYCRWSFEIPEADLAEDTREKDRLLVHLGKSAFPALEPDLLVKMLQERAPWFEGSIESFRWRMVVRFERRLAGRFGDNRVWLAGDAAHMANPVGMRSMNLGLREAHTLGTAAASGNGNVTSRLSECGQSWLADWGKVQGVGRSLQADSKADRWIADRADLVFDSLPCGLPDANRLLEQVGLRME